MQKTQSSKCSCERRSVEFQHEINLIETRQHIRVPIEYNTIVISILQYQPIFLFSKYISSEAKNNERYDAGNQISSKSYETHTQDNTYVQLFVKGCCYARGHGK